MKLQPDTSQAPLIRSQGPGWLQIDQRRYEASVFLHSQRSPAVMPWAPARFEDLQASDFDLGAVDDCELVLFGSGQRLRFVPPVWTAWFLSRRIGLETMDTAAACRTYNVLASEGRKVAALLLLEAGECAA
jgi:uncharacterized protein